jgi:hypothetical protein
VQNQTGGLRPNRPRDADHAVVGMVFEAVDGQSQMLSIDLFAALPNPIASDIPDRYR